MGRVGEVRRCGVGATITGASHERDGTGNQDNWLAASAVRDGSVVLAVADGAGSARHADEGSRIACDAVVGHILWAREQGVAVTRETLTGSLRAARDAICRQADAGSGKRRGEVAADRAGQSSVRDGGCPPREFATTLLLAVLSDGRTDTELSVATVGDGAVVVLDRGALDCVAAGPRGEYVNETFFITDEDWEEHVTTWSGAVGDDVAVALLTDGVEAVSVTDAGTRPVTGFFMKVFDFVARGGSAHDVTQVLCSPRVRQLSDDDKTLVVLAAERPRDAARASWGTG